MIIFINFYVLGKQAGDPIIVCNFLPLMGEAEQSLWGATEAADNALELGNNQFEGNAKKLLENEEVRRLYLSG